MKDISIAELKVIVRAGLSMAQINPTSNYKEQNFLNYLIDLSQFSHDELKLIEQEGPFNFSESCEKLKSENAKKLFLLTMTAVALAGDQLGDQERILIESINTQLRVGKLKLQELSFKVIEKKVLDTITYVIESHEKVTTNSDGKDLDYDFFGG
ncbi:MAG: hypothetical protein OEY59_08045 [Deltaproteobacteria bacterium]|nr:hypothetical protein [Deltaproteobacteria bacterium]